MSKPVFLAFKDTGTNEVAGAFDKVGDSSRRMAKQVDESTASQTRLGERIGSNESKFMGTADLLDGLGGAFGLPTEGATQLFRGLGDLSGGFEVVSGILPSLSGMFPRLAGAMTFVSAHPLLIAVMAGGAIIAGLILLEKKFGVVSGAVEGLGDAFSWVWSRAIKPAINGILGGIEMMVNGMSSVFNGSLGRLPGIPSIPRVSLPRLDVGGTVLQTGIAVVHRGEVVSPAAGTPSRSAGDTVIVYVSGSVVTEDDLIDSIHAGLLKKQNRSGGLGLVA